MSTAVGFARSFQPPVSGGDAAPAGRAAAPVGAGGGSHRDFDRLLSDLGTRQDAEATAGSADAQVGPVEAPPAGRTLAELLSNATKPTPVRPPAAPTESGRPASASSQAGPAETAPADAASSGAALAKTAPSETTRADVSPVEAAPWEVVAVDAAAAATAVSAPKAPMPEAAGTLPKGPQAAPAQEPATAQPCARADTAAAALRNRPPAAAAPSVAPSLNDGTAGGAFAAAVSSDAKSPFASSTRGSGAGGAAAARRANEPHAKTASCAEGPPAMVQVPVAGVPPAPTAGTVRGDKHEEALHEEASPSARSAERDGIRVPNSPPDHAVSAGPDAGEPVASVAVTRQETHLPIVVQPPVLQLADAIRSQLAEGDAQSAPADTAPADTVASTLPAAGRTMVRTLAITLAPAHLGTLRIEMRLASGRLELSIDASRHEAARTIEQDRTALSDAMTAAGITLDGMVVRSGAADARPMNGGTDGSWQTSNQPAGQQGGYAATGGNGTDRDQRGGGREDGPRGRQGEPQPVERPRAAGAARGDLYL